MSLPPSNLSVNSILQRRVATYLHNRLTVDAKESTAHHLQINSGQRQRPPFAFGLLVNFCDFCLFCNKAALQHHCHDSSIKEMHPFPKEVDFLALPIYNDLESPEVFGFEIFDSQVSVNNESQRRKLT